MAAFDERLAQQYFAANPDVAQAYAANSNGMTPGQFAQFHFDNYGKAEGRQLTAPSDYNQGAAQPAMTPWNRLDRSNADPATVTQPLNPFQARQNQRQVDAGTNQGAYQQRGAFTNLQNQAMSMYDDIAKNLLGDDYKAWRAAKLGVPTYSYVENGQRKQAPTIEYLQNKFGTSDYYGYLASKGLPTLPPNGAFSSMGDSGAGIQAYQQFMNQLRPFMPAGQNQGMFGGGTRGRVNGQVVNTGRMPNQQRNSTQAPYSGPRPTNISPLQQQVTDYFKANPNKLGPQVGSAAPVQTIVPGAGTPQASAGAFSPQAPGAVTGGGMYPTVGDSSAWQAQRTTLTPQQQGLFSSQG